MRLLLQGYGGRMGRIIRGLAAAKGHEVVALPREGEINSIGESCDLVIDFSSSSGLDTAIALAQSKQIPLLSGTTNLTATTRRHLSEAAKKIPIVWSSNFSLAALCLQKLATIAREFLPQTFDLEIVEIHHRGKKDRPSGTAKALQEAIAAHQEVPIHSLRGGDNPGIHAVLLLGEGENLCLRHEVLDRNIFGIGALYAAERLLARSPKNGLFSFEEIIGQERSLADPMASN